MAVESTGGVLGRAYNEPPWNSRADILCAVEKVWGIGGEETPTYPTNLTYSTLVMRFAYSHGHGMEG
jgi:hypothetical protein